MSKDDVKITEEVHVEVTPGHDPLGAHRTAVKKSSKHVAAAVLEESPEEEDDPGLTVISEESWTVQDLPEGYLVIDRPQDWPTQDYVNKPPARVLFEHPFPDSI